MAVKDIGTLSPEIFDLAQKCVDNSGIDASLYGKYDVKKGLRDINGKGVLAGLTEISEIQSSKIVDGKSVPCEGQLFYRGQNIENLVQGFIREDRFGFEEVTYLLLFGELPNKTQLADFCKLLNSYRTLPTNFTRDVIMKAPSSDIMNSLARSVLTLYGYDSNANDTSIPNVLRQCLMLISVFPMLAVYSYQAYNHYICDKSLYIHYPNPNLSTAENILRMLRPDKAYSHLEAKVLDIALVLHMEHGGGNNSTFTTHVVSSSGTDTYSAIAAALGSLKGPKHGGAANIKVVEMFNDLRLNVRDTTDEDELREYLIKLLDKKAFDGKGLIYGMGHAVYSISDPRANIFKGFVEQLAKEKDRTADFKLYSTVERLAKEVIAKKHHIYKGVSANVDFYSGFVYSMLDLPNLITPIFAIARITGWSAHRIEELINVDKIIRPAYQCIKERVPYVALDER